MPPTDPNATYVGAWGARHSAEPRARVVAARYELGAALGAGGAGEVYQAKDRLANEDVAVKLLSPMSAEQLARVRREIAALRTLRLPGVVQLRDDGVDEGDHFLVMDLVLGTRFPGEGVGAEWDKVGPRAVRLLETLALVHAAGVIHRDLKPANVLVDAAGQPTMLDFGIARGPALGDTITARSALLGTPRYLAPEQLQGEAVGPPADLYALGVMLYEVLAGRLPHPDRDVHELYLARMATDAPSLRDHCPQLPRRVTDFVDRLLSRRPSDRPGSAIDALDLLGEDSALDLRSRALPRLGGDDVVQGLAAAARAGERAQVAGERGSGRTRALRETSAVLEREGREVGWTIPGQRPYESLLPIVGQPPASGEPGQVLLERLQARLDEGFVVVVDGDGRLDHWSRSLLGRVRGAVLSSSDPPGVLRLQPLTEADLRPLFHGPDRILHLQEDAAHQLFRRAGGSPARIADDLAAWVAARLATWKDGRLLVTRDAIEQLASGLGVALPIRAPTESTRPLDGPLEDVLTWVALAWPEASPELLGKVSGFSGWELDVLLDELLRRGAVHSLPDGRLRSAVPDARARWPETRRRDAHRALAAALSPGSGSRLGHLVAAGDFGAAAEEALRVARATGQQGFAVRAMGVTTLGLSVARLVDGAPLEPELLRELTFNALRAWTTAASETALYELGRATCDAPALGVCRAVLRATLDSWRGNAEAAWSSLAGLSAPDDTELDIWLHTVRIQAAAARGSAWYEAALGESEAWSTTAPEKAALHAGWLGVLRYRQGRFDEAATLHSFAGAHREDAAGRLSATLNAAAALIDAGRLEEAAALARGARGEARSYRQVSFEARAEWALRSVAYRLGEGDTPDLELVEAVHALALPALEAQICLTEASCAWRAGALASGAELAGRARQIWTTIGFAAGALLAEALEVVCADVRDPTRIRTIAGRTLRGHAPRLAVQALGLLACAAPELAKEWAEPTRKLAEGLDRPDARNEVLAVSEALAYIRGSRGASS